MIVYAKVDLDKRWTSANWQPIYLLFVSKFFGKALLSCLPAFSEAKDFFPVFHLVFRPKGSKQHPCITLLNFLHSALDSGLLPGHIVLDLRKAFDSFTPKF